MNKQDVINQLAELFLQNKDKFKGYTNLKDVVKMADPDVVSKYVGILDYISFKTPNLEQFSVAKCKEILKNDRYCDEKLSECLNLNGFNDFFFTAQTLNLLSTIPNMIIAKFGDNPQNVLEILKSLISEKTDEPRIIQTTDYFSNNNEVGQYLRQHNLMDDFIAWGQKKLFTYSYNSYYSGIYALFGKQKPTRKVKNFNGILLMEDYGLYDYEVDMKSVIDSSLDNCSFRFKNKTIKKIVAKSGSRAAYLIAIYCQKDFLEPNNVKITNPVKYTEGVEEFLQKIDYLDQQEINELRNFITPKQKKKVFKPAL